MRETKFDPQKALEQVIVDQAQLNAIVKRLPGPDAVTANDRDLLREAARLSKQLLATIERIEAWDAAIGLAYGERMGVDLLPGGAYSAADHERSLEILELFPEVN